VSATAHAAATPVQGGEAQRLVRCAYRIRDLFDGSEMAVAAWSRQLRADLPSDRLIPPQFAGATAGLLVKALRDAGVLGDDEGIDAFRLAGFQQVIALLPYFREEEASRRPAPALKVVFTVPDGVKLPDEATHLNRLLSKRVFDALVSATTRTLLASPYWSDLGADELWAPLQHSVGSGLPITLAGAKPDPKRDDLEAMLRLGARLKAKGAAVHALQFVPPKPTSIFHAKVVAGAVGYLGSANLTSSGLGLHVEAGLPLDEPDVEQVWWLLDVLVAAGLLREIAVTKVP
jgi:hypothetical protein